MASRAVRSDTIPNVRGYTSARVFDGVRKFTKDAGDRHVLRVKAAMAKRAAKTA